MARSPLAQFTLRPPAPLRYAQDSFAQRSRRTQGKLRGEVIFALF